MNEARDDGREALISVALGSVHGQPAGRTYSVAEVKQIVYPLIETLRKHPEPDSVRHDEREARIWREGWMAGWLNRHQAQPDRNGNYGISAPVENPYEVDRAARECICPLRGCDAHAAGPRMPAEEGADTHPDPGPYTESDHAKYEELRKKAQQ